MLHWKPVTRFNISRSVAVKASFNILKFYVAVNGKESDYGIVCLICFSYRTDFSSLKINLKTWHYAEKFALSILEFGVFVNSSGCHSRKKPLMWSRLPLAFGEYQPWVPSRNRTSSNVKCSFKVSSENSFMRAFSLLRVHSLGVIRIRISDPRVLGSRCIKGTDRSTEWIHRFLLCTMICYQRNAPLVLRGFGLVSLSARRLEREVKNQSARGVWCGNAKRELARRLVSQFDQS